MEAIRIKAASHNGKLTVHVPHEFDEKELEVIILSAGKEEAPFATTDKDLQQKKIKSLMDIAGSAKYPDFPVTKHDTYEQ